MFLVILGCYGILNTKHEKFIRTEIFPAIVGMLAAQSFCIRVYGSY